LTTSVTRTPATSATPETSTLQIPAHDTTTADTAPSDTTGTGAPALATRKSYTFSVMMFCLGSGR
jgi:hypothetical protein